MIARKTMLAALGLMLGAGAGAQQVPDLKADTNIASPAFPLGTGPAVLIDSAHGEFHTIDNRFAPFAALLTHDGYKVGGLDQPLSPQLLAGARVLVIGNATNHATRLSRKPGEDSTSAFTDAEVTMIRHWVEGGGALLLVFDHPPYSGGARTLAAAFGVTIDAYAVAPPRGQQEIFTRANKGLADSPLTAGVDQVQTFFGTAFHAPAGAIPILRLNDQWTIGQGADAQQASDKDLRGAALTVGRGRVVMMSEASELSAQRNAKNGGAMGFNAPGATGNKRLVRNIVHWLATGT